MKFRKLIVILLAAVFVCGNYSYAQDADKKSVPEETKEEKPARQVRDRSDAIQIAKDYLEEQGMQSDYHLFGHLMGKPLAKLKDDVWHVVFLKKKKDDRTVQTESVRIMIEDSTARVVEHEEQEGFFLDGSF